MAGKVERERPPLLPGPATDGDFDLRWLGAVIDEREWHFHRRLFERYGIVLAPGEFTMIVRRVRSKKTPTMMNKTCKRRIHFVTIPSVKVPILIVSDGRFPKTAWPPKKALLAQFAAITAPAHPALGTSDQTPPPLASGGNPHCR